MTWTHENVCVNVLTFALISSLNMFALHYWPSYINADLRMYVFDWQFLGITRSNTHSEFLTFVVNGRSQILENFAVFCYSIYNFDENTKKIYYACTISSPLNISLTFHKKYNSTWIRRMVDSIDATVAISVSADV